MSLVLSVLVHSVAAATFGLLQLQPILLQHLIPPMTGTQAQRLQVIEMKNNQKTPAFSFYNS
jgi:hypothetical protein